MNDSDWTKKKKKNELPAHALGTLTADKVHQCWLHSELNRSGAQRVPPNMHPLRIVYGHRSEISEHFSFFITSSICHTLDS